MSYIRFGEDGSNVYMYGSKDDWICCCFCALAEKSQYLKTHQDAMMHLDEHRKHGHIVPEHVYERLRAEDAEKRQG